MLDYSPRRSRLTFQVDVFQAHGRLPRDLDEVNERDKDIRYSSRTMVSTNAFRDKHEVRHAINELYKLLLPDLANTEQAKRLYDSNETNYASPEAVGSTGPLGQFRGHRPKIICRSKRPKGGKNR